jgi:hypothetical protein
MARSLSGVELSKTLEGLFAAAGRYRVSGQGGEYSDSPPAVFTGGRSFLFFGHRFFAHGLRLLVLHFLAHRRSFADSELLDCLVIQLSGRL